VPDRSRTNSGDDQTSETTQLLRAWADGDQGALERLLRAFIAPCGALPDTSFKMSGRGTPCRPRRWCTRPTWNLSMFTNVDWQHRAHFFAVSAQIMRHILLDRARRRAWRPSEAAARSG
jgi:hypothetical protein